jgi:glycosyltransferase involved in cell wall biosynthesis
MRVLFLNNYPMEEVFKLWKERRFPGHHLWGITELERLGFEVDILAYETFPERFLYDRLLGRRRTRLNVGLGQQIRALCRGRYDVVYSGCQYHTWLLAHLRSRGLFRKPIVAILHHPLAKSQITNDFVNGHDRLICLSNGVKNSVLSSGLDFDRSKLRKLQWGVDLNFYSRWRTGLGKNWIETRKVVSAGISNRDHDVLAQAVIGLNCEVNIYCSKDSRPTTEPLPENVSVSYRPNTEIPICYPNLVSVYEETFVICIPLRRVDFLSGLTSLMDALALGRPVIMTRNRYVDIDIEALGFGLWIEPGDVLGWRLAISTLLENPALALEMGEKAAELGKQRFTIQRFSEDLARIFAEL